MAQLRANIDYCAAWMLVRPNELVRVSAAFQAAFPAPNDGKDRCDFVAAVPISVAHKDWKVRAIWLVFPSEVDVDGGERGRGKRRQDKERKRQRGI